MVRRRREPESLTPGFLRRAKVQPNTLARYTAALTDFEATTGIHLSTFTRRGVKDLDKFVES